MTKPYIVNRLFCPGDLQPACLWIVRGPGNPAVFGGVYSDNGPADEQCRLLNDAYRRGHDDGVAEHTAILRNAAKVNNDNQS